MAHAYGIPFHYLPVNADTRAEQEQQILNIVARENVDLVVLARYMQILTTTLCKALSGKAINIHHSFLPSFKGARPYHQGNARGVKIIRSEDPTSELQSLLRTSFAVSCLKKKKHEQHTNQ